MLAATRKNSLTLAVFACIFTGLVALTEYLTKDRIKEKETAQVISILDHIIPHNLYDNNLHQCCTLITDPALGTNRPLPSCLATLNGQPTALTIETIAPDGYNGEIKMIIGIKRDGTITGVRILSHKETPGLGNKIDFHITDWALSFTGQKITDSVLSNWKVKKDGGKFDQFTGATITPRAVVKAVKNAVLYINQNQDTLFSKSLDCRNLYE
ncbi:electron transport complex protein [Candidatus Photodesmus blepharus]|uniref:Ion-translocating oxidoreductase complex subunit G n=1 Tax=Candidatus Photodesmus blepharonis TaxID=1179155 RepID=A0A084CN16_9GAMM|nr:electron transport complex subunit RsxG [Candidatus Photodesmus blepharus]KEY91195.1 electron transport complex protein [Candidatus Photodesmus blepharus]